jgi:hypothetical protein
VSYKDLKEVREYYSTLRDLVIQNSGGWDDAASRAKVARLCSAAIAALDDPECRERLRTVERQAAELFSRDAHLKWKRANMSGADYLRLQILIALEGVNTRLFFLDALRNRASQAGTFPADPGGALENPP